MVCWSLFWSACGVWLLLFYPSLLSRFSEVFSQPLCFTFQLPCAPGAVPPAPPRVPSSARTTAAVSGVSWQRDAAGAPGRVSGAGWGGGWIPGAGEGAGGRGWDPGTKGFVCTRAWGHRLMLHGLLGGDRNLAPRAARPAGFGVLGADAVLVFPLVSFEG